MVAVEQSTGVSNQASFQRVGKTPYGELTGGEESDSSSAPEHRIRNQHRWVLTRAVNEPSRSFPFKNMLTLLVRGGAHCAPPYEISL